MYERLCLVDEVGVVQETEIEQPAVTNTQEWKEEGG